VAPQTPKPPQQPQPPRRGACRQTRGTPGPLVGRLAHAGPGRSRSAGTRVRVATAPRPPQQPRDHDQPTPQLTHSNPQKQMTPQPAPEPAAPAPCSPTPRIPYGPTRYYLSEGRGGEESLSRTPQPTHSNPQKQMSPQPAAEPTASAPCSPTPRTPYGPTRYYFSEGCGGEESRTRVPVQVGSTQSTTPAQETAPPPQPPPQQTPPQPVPPTSPPPTPAVPSPRLTGLRAHQLNLQMQLLLPSWNVHPSQRDEGHWEALRELLQTTRAAAASLHAALHAQCVAAMRMHTTVPAATPPPDHTRSGSVRGPPPRALFSLLTPPVGGG
jgi:hypothetical protein